MGYKIGDGTASELENDHLLLLIGNVIYHVTPFGVLGRRKNHIKVTCPILLNGCLNTMAVTFSHQVHGSGSSVAYLQYRRGTPDNHRGGGGIETVPSALIILRSSGDHF
ncbi:hypothetical protein CDAR_418641 [Caerostris darwini]|uniref:Uncharacterized protein n=1 Tax=Caerostris darwini TaxID=1538125 RepID=A0AAV4MVA4_9ARAC|nr:hypothetical protein CDAR_418641 [Caerostris darwini]